MKGIITFICIVIGIVFSVASAQEKDMKDAQEVVKAGSLGSFNGNVKNFSGDVKVKMMFKSTHWQHFGGALVEFAKGARSAWHSHPAGQTLIVTSGAIITGTKSGEILLAKEGDVILCPPNVEHWHGALDSMSGAHIAITHEKDGKNVEWHTLVSDDTYKKAIEHIYSQKR